MRGVEVAVVGGGPAGAALAIRLARSGHEVVVFERLAQPRWRAAGVYSSPLTRRRLAALGLADGELDRLIRPISAMVVRTVDGRAEARLEYRAPATACGVDRVRLERAMLDHAVRAGAEVNEGTAVTGLDLSEDRPVLTLRDAGGSRQLRARLIVGADGPSSIVARAAGVVLPGRRFRRAALTVHRTDPDARPAGRPMEAELLVGRGWYCGVAPVPGGRVNLGLVVGEAALRAELAGGSDPAGVLERRLRAAADLRRGWVDAPATDGLQVALPLLHRVRRAAGVNFLLVGDAAGFIDPISGEGLHRALVSADLAASEIHDWSGGRRGALADYDQHMRRRFTGKDVLSWLLQPFVANPALARRALHSLERAELRRTLALALADVLPPSRVVDPRYLGRVLLAG